MKGHFRERHSILFELAFRTREAPLLARIISLGAVWVYTPLFFIVFIETGLVFFPFLPGDSLLFAAGVFSADGDGLNIWATLIVFYVAAVSGNTSNYWIARFFGARIIDSGKIKALTPERMAKLDHFFAKYGGLTIVITRFSCHSSARLRRSSRARAT